VVFRQGQPRRGPKSAGCLGSGYILGLCQPGGIDSQPVDIHGAPLAQHELANLLYSPSDSSFPANSVAVALAAAMAIWLGNRRGGQALSVLAVLGSFPRVYSGIFYPSDVSAGELIGAAEGCLVTLGLRVIESVTTWALKGASYPHLA